MKGMHVVQRRRPGKPSRWYVYAWRGGPQVHAHVGSRRPVMTPAIYELARAALTKRTTPSAAAQTLRDLILGWRSRDPRRPASPEWLALSDNTRRTWGSELDRIDSKWGETPLAIWDDARMKRKVVEWRDSRAATPRAADMGVTTLSALLKFGLIRGLVSVNVAAEVPRLYRNGQRSDIIWTENDIERFKAAALERGWVQVIDGLRLAALTGLRREDLVTITWDHVGEDVLLKRALKTSAGRRLHAAIPRTPALNALLDDLRLRERKPDVQTLLVNSHGLPWTGSGFGSSFNRVRDAADIVHVDSDTGKTSRKHLHDLRGTYCTGLISTNRFTDSEIATIMGWAPERVSNIRRVYVEHSQIISALANRIRVRTEVPS